MVHELSKCPNCGKVFATRAGKLWCAACSANRVEDLDLIELAWDEGRGETAEEIAAFTGLAIERVEQLLRESRGYDVSTPVTRLCMRCEKRPADQGADFCWPCRAELYKSFGDAADDLFARLDPVEYRPQFSGRGWGIVTALSEKRRRVGASRLNPTPRNRYSG